MYRPKLHLRINVKFHFPQKEFSHYNIPRSFCGPNTDCHNTEASYYCTCKLGYENWAETSGKIVQKKNLYWAFNGV